MSNLLALSLPVRNARAGVLNTYLNGGAIEFYSGARAIGPDFDAGSAILSCTVALRSPAGSVSGGVWTAYLPEHAPVVVPASVNWARLKSSSGVVIADGSVGIVGSGAAFELTSVALGEGLELTPGSISITEG